MAFLLIASPAEIRETFSLWESVDASTDAHTDTLALFLGHSILRHRRCPRFAAKTPKPPSGFPNRRTRPTPPARLAPSVTIKVSSTAHAWASSSTHSSLRTVLLHAADGTLGRTVADGVVRIESRTLDR